MNSRFGFETPSLAHATRRLWALGIVALVLGACASSPAERDGSTRDSGSRDSGPSSARDSGRERDSGGGGGDIDAFRAQTDTGTTGGRDAATCPSGMTACGGDCVDTQTDSAHCGACDEPCSNDETCSSGMCREMLVCTAEQIDCGAGCIDVLMNNANCGRCGRACASGESCMAGACVPSTCPGSEMRCGAACVNTQTDSSNCGSCGTACAAGEQCSGGTCSAACGSPRRVCGTGASATCADVQTDNANCGNCGTVCGAGQTCTGGTCGCPSGRTSCGGACVDTQTDGMNCGSCGDACDEGQVCASGSCGCAAPTTLCGNSCVVTSVDPNHCGNCATVCGGSTPACISGSCQATSCTSGQIPCGAAGCVDPRVDAANCGMCGNVCGAGTTCSNAVCRPTNDLRANATILNIVGGETTLVGSSTGATKDGPTSGTECAGCTTGGNVWYLVRLAEAGALYLDTQGSSFDTKLFVTNGSGALLTAGTGESWCEDDGDCSGVAGWGTRDARVYGWLPAGDYYVSVGGCATGSFTLHAQFLAQSESRFFYTAPISGNALTADTALLASGIATSTCGGTGSGEDARWFVTCGGQAQTFSLCRSDSIGFIFLDRPQWERAATAASTTTFDPTLYLLSGQTGEQIACNDDGASMGATDCRGYTDNNPSTFATAEFGSRLNGITVPRGIAAIFVDSRTGNGGMNYRMLHRITDAP